MSASADLYAVMAKRDGRRLRAVCLGARKLGALPPVWALWNGLWLTFAVQIAVLIAAAAYAPAAFSLVFAGLAILHTLEGGPIEVAELRLRGWREATSVEARSGDGALELHLKGQAA